MEIQQTVDTNDCIIACCLDAAEALCHSAIERTLAGYNAAAIVCSRDCKIASEPGSILVNNRQCDFNNNPFCVNIID